ncbi:hypothetical protein VNO77_35492 [Canavalia gladiata]|uniref:Uncharacterized protein n=1 Tax=Canavalia gladiata TaxID=3824 RepID=A0AAN9KEQ8_CANGL
MTVNKIEEKPRGRRSKFSTEDNGGGDKIECCSSKYCKSCTGGYIADCVAIICCPCVVLHCFAMAFVRVPCVVGRRCLGLGKKNKKKNNNNNNKGKVKMGHEDVVLERGVRVGCPSADPSTSSASCSVEEIEGVTVNAGLEAEVWKELNQIGHLDFGRLSNSELGVALAQ